MIEALRHSPGQPGIFRAFLGMILGNRDAGMQQEFGHLNGTKLVLSLFGTSCR